MPQQHQPKPWIMVGNKDSSVSQHLMAHIQQDNTIVSGVIGEGSSVELQSNWDSPFEQDNPGSFFEKIGGLLQTGALLESAKGYTSKTTLNSAQVWGGNKPITITLALNLYALSNPQVEVEDAISALMYFASPEANATSPIAFRDGSMVMGRIPGNVMLKLGRNFIYKDMVIESISQPMDVVRDRNGNRIRCTVQLQLQTDRMVGKKDIASLRGQVS